MLILAGHGSGIVGDFLTDSSQAPGSRSSLTIPSLGRTFRRLQSKLEREGLRRKNVAIDVLGLDSCLMSMGEICSEVAGEVLYLVGSEGFDPNTGWPYFRLLEELRKRPEGSLLEPKDLADKLVSMYTLYYSDYSDADVSVDMSACDVTSDKIQAIQGAVREFAEFYVANEAGHPLIRSAVVLAHWRAQSYKWEQYTDIVDFFEQVAEECTKLLHTVHATTPVHVKLTDMCKRCDAVIASVNGAVTSNNCSGPEFQHSHGLSVYFPWSRSQYEVDYSETSFAKSTHWDCFLEAYVDGTRRVTRARALRRGSPSKASRVTTAADLEMFIDSRLTRPGCSTVRPHGGATRSQGETSSFQPGGGPMASADEPSSGGNLMFNRANAPSNRANAPSNRANAPSNRFAQYIGSLMNELPSRMKNPATDAAPVVLLMAEDRTRLQQLMVSARGKPTPLTSARSSRRKPKGASGNR